MSVTDRRALGAGAFLGAGALLLLTEGVTGAQAQPQTQTQTPPAASPEPPAPAPADTHYVGLTAKGQLYHTIRRADGEWDRWAERDGPLAAEFVGAACAGAGDALHVVAVTAEGRLYHTIRHADGRWDRWGERERPSGDLKIITKRWPSGVTSNCRVVLSGRMRMSGPNSACTLSICTPRGSM